MKYEDALKCWGYQKIKAQIASDEAVTMNDLGVRMVFSRGYACCGGTDPDCYCSLAESPRAEVTVSARTTKGRYIESSIDLEDFDFVETLKEILEASNGSIEL